MYVFAKYTEIGVFTNPKKAKPAEKISNFFFNPRARLRSQITILKKIDLYMSTVMPLQYIQMGIVVFLQYVLVKFSSIFPLIITQYTITEEKIDTYLEEELLPT